MDRETIINLPKKLFKYILAVKLVAKAVTVGERIYRFIPKFDKITGIDTAKFEQMHLPK